MVQKNQIEIGHFYLDELLCDINLDYLYDFKHLFVNSDLYLFLDDIHINKCRLDYTGLKNKAESIVNQNVTIIFESEMKKYVHLIKNDVEIKRKKFNDKIKDCILLNGKYHSLFEVYPNYTPTCLAYSLAWTKYRLSKGNVITIIDEKYKSIEDKVKEIYKCNVYYIYHHLVFFADEN
jgi:hypothetical protein